MNDAVKKKLIYFGLLAVGVCCQLVPIVFRTGWWTGAAALVWMYTFLDLVSRFRAKKELLLTGVIFVLGYCLFFSGAMGSGVGVLLFLVFGLGVFATVYATSCVMRRWNRFPATLFLPVLWLAEYLLATLLRFPSMVRVDMLFADMPLLIQAERLIGPAGLSFALLWAVALLRFAAENRSGRCALLGAGLLLVLLVPGIFYLAPNTRAAESVRVAYTTGPYVGDFLNYTTVSYAENEQSMERAVRNAASQKAEMLVFNEEAFEMPDKDEERFRARCSELAKENSIFVLLGLDISDSDGSNNGKAENKLVLFGSDGQELGEYAKARLIPFIESDYEPGRGDIPSHVLNINGKTVKISYLICYDSNFPSYVHRVQADTDILFLPSWDWDAVTELHSKLCRTIAVENHFSILKPTYDGLSIAVAPDGEIISLSSTDKMGFEMVHVVDMPLKSSIEVVKNTQDSSPYTYAIIGAETLSVFVCLVLMLGNIIENNERTKRTRWFTALAATSMVGCIADDLSWILDGCARLSTVLYLSTALSIIMTFIILATFCSYLTEHVKERKEGISNTPVTIAWVYAWAAVVLAIIASVAGKLFSFENGVYSDGPLYSAYVIANALSILLGFGIIIFYRKSIDLHDRLIAYIYMAIPVVFAVINLFAEEWSFAYPAITLSLLVIYVLLQSDKVEQLEQKGSVVSYHASHDELTGLYNKRAFQNRLEVLKSIDGESGIIFGDLNGLKYTNDNYGHLAGDQLLIRFAGVLSSIFRMSEIYRMGGDEFICMMESVPKEVFESRLAELKERLSQDEMPLACIGAEFGSNRDIEALIKSAETRMYEEKEIVHARFPQYTR